MRLPASALTETRNSFASSFIKWLQPVVGKSIFLAAFLFPALSSFSQHKNIDVVHYEFNIGLTDTNDTIDCSAVIDLNIKNAGNIDLDLISRKADGKGMKVVSVADEETKELLGFTHSNDILHIDNNAGHRVIRINYKGIPADGLIIAKNKYNERTFFSDNWPIRARHWLVCNDHPSDKAAVDFIVTAPVHYQVVSNGIQVEETNLSEKTKLTHWKETESLATKVMCIGVAEFAVGYAGEAGNVPVYSWVYPQDREKGFSDYALAVRPLKFFENNLAPFPYRKLANVESKTIFGGLENASAIFYSESSITGKGKTEALLAHELAHQWFGNTATESDWKHLWLSEGFATYFSLLYLENRYGTDTLTRKLKTDRNKIIAFYRERATPVVDSTVTDYMQLLNANSYEKGSWILHMLRKQLGDSVFWNGIRRYYNKYAGKNASTSDFEKSMEESSGRDLGQFFHQWLFVAGHPQLHIDHQYSNKTLTINITQQQDYIFQFPLTIVVHSKNGGTDFTRAVRVNKKKVTVTMPMDNEPGEIIIDPFTSLLFEEK